MMGITNASEIIVIIIIAVVIIFGAKKIPELARSFGKASTEYEKSKIQAKKEIELIRSGNYNSDNNLNREKLETIADTLGIDCSARSDEELRNAIETEIRKQK
ncbi:MAG: twin-arginine translocase TatA/TatE family subunit [Nitrososphaeraceae archaeon]